MKAEGNVSHRDGFLNRAHIVLLRCVEFFDPASKQAVSRHKRSVLFSSSCLQALSPLPLPLPLALILLEPRLSL